MQETPIKHGAAKAAGGIDWSQWLCPGPRRVFTADEMARGGDQPWPKAIDGYIYSNAVILLAINYNQLPRGLALASCAIVLLCVWAALSVAHGLWYRPTRRRLNWVSGLAALLMVTAALLVKQELAVGGMLAGFPAGASTRLGLLVAAIFIVAVTAWWFLTLYRAQQIEARLRELADQDAALRLSRRLATAQIQPHFLFNTLASVQHWVDTQDPRAGPTLRSFTQYLRATLPMFERETLSLAEELQMVRSYLEVMQARLGERLRWRIDVEAALLALPLPPGALLTLAENAIAHGIEPSLHGGSIVVRGRCSEGRRACLEVEDDGPGLTESACDGVGLANTRARLAQLHGERASLSLQAGPEGGCLARLELPLAPASTQGPQGSPQP